MDSNAQHTAPALTNRQQIARNKCYEIAYSEAKNRIYYSILGFWKNEESVPDFFADWDRALQVATSGFDLVVDMRTMITHPQQLNRFHEEALQKVQKSGVSRMANIMPLDRIASLQAAEIIKWAGLASHNFDTCEDADKWLDELMA
jgi:hypothetical protein